MKQQVKSTWITANAGSGKTYTLTQRVLRLLLLGVPPERIVCITYTKAAASEMHARVLGELRKLLLADESNCHKKIQELLGTEPDVALITHARSLFGQVLDSASGGMLLTTIHGFCQDILRRFPLEAGIAPHFTVLEDQAASELLRRVKYTLLVSLESADDWLTEALSLIGARGGEYRFETLADDIISKRLLWEEVWRGQSPESLRAHLENLHGIEPGTTREQLDAALCEAPADAQRMRNLLPEMLSNKKKTEQKYASGLIPWLEAEGEGRLPHIANLCKLLLTNEGTIRAEILKLDDSTNGSGLILGLAEAAQRYQSALAALACIEESFAAAIFARALLDLYKQSKIAAHALDYDDLITHTLQLLSHPDTLGWVMSKLDHRIDHLLIDEAQDNSSLQWQLAKLLVEELIASNDGVGSAGVPRSLLVVGDEKQSIYSFQGAAPEQFQRNHAYFMALMEHSPSGLIAESLDNSYRSSATVLKLVDHICAQPEMASAVGATVQQHQLIRTHAAGRVVLHPPIIAPEKEVTEAMVMPTEYKIKTTAAQRLAEEIAEATKQMIVSGEATAGDILILVHRRKPLVAPLIRALQRRQVAVAGIDRLILAEHLAVRDLLALISWCLNPQDDLALAQVLRSPLMGWSDEQLHAAAHGRSGSLWAEVTSPWLAEARARKEQSPYDFLTWVLEVSTKRRDFARRFGEEVHEVLDELKAQSAAIPDGMQPTLANFYDWISTSARTIKREQETVAADHVRIMTVHGAKGLEAPVVILADTVSVPTTQRERIFIATDAHQQKLPVLAMSETAKQATQLERAKEAKKEKLREEYARLLYVALTRARDTLHIFGSASKQGEVKDGSWYEVIEKAMRALAAEEREGRLELSNAGTAEPKSKESAAPAAPLPVWVTEAPKTSAAAAQPSLAPSRLMDAQPSPYAAQSDGTLRERGVRIHRVLELLSATSTEASISKLVRAISPDWDSATQAKATAEITKLYTQQHWLWQHPRTPEATIAGTLSHQDASIPVSGQIDALIETPDEIIILDYKTGSHIPANAASVPQSYILQLKLYHALVSQIYPQKHVRCAILWTAGPTLMWLDEQVQNAAFPDLTSVLKTTLAA